MILVRNGPNHADDPFTATFHCSPTLSKPDVVQYLRQVYGLEMTGIRTAIYRESPRKVAIRKRMFKSKSEQPFRLEATYKKVYVQLLHPFMYPPEPHEGSLNLYYARDEYLKRAAADRARAGDHVVKGWAAKTPSRPRDPNSEDKPRSIVRTRQQIGEQRAQKEEAILKEMRRRKGSTSSF